VTDDTGRARPSQADTPMVDASEGDPERDVLGADLDDSGTDGRPGPQERGEVPRAPAGPEDAPVDPDQPTNPA
jgi:hypothetical protein